MKGTFHSRQRRHARASQDRDRRARLEVVLLEDRVVPANAIVTENQLPGSPPSEWDIGGAGDPSIQGFATDISVDQGQTISFKINDTARAPYHIDIYRVGYYGGNGARKVATIPSSATLRQVQPNPLTNASTGLIDCGNWAVSASWSVPATATSGVYLAVPVREDTGGASHIPFIVRDDDGRSDLLFQTADTTWQAYNNWGGNSLYVGSPAGRAYKVSYNRPWNTRAATPSGRDFFFGTEYPMVRWLEANGYNVSYTTDVDTDRRGAELLEHKVFLSVGHDEYWSGQQRANVEAARDAGVNLAFFSGNEVYWKTRWENSIDASGTPYRTLVCYKETFADAKIDPMANVWTGTWRDYRFSPPADGGRPENALTGTIFTVNRGPGGETGTAFNVPHEFASLRLWRNTSVANLQPGQTAVLGDRVLGYEWDEDLDNGFRPAGLIRLSSTTQNVPEKIDEFGHQTTTAGVATHSLTLYRAASGALVFGAGTIQWSWGLDGTHDGVTTTPDVRMQQATVNLFADMGVQPETPRPGVVPAAASTDTTRPTSTITSPAAGAVLQVGTPVTISGTATDTGGGVVGGVEVSTDGGTTWRRATGRGSWSYVWTPTSTGTVTIRSRAADDSGNIQATPASVTVTVSAGNTLVAAYSFDAGSGTTLADSSGRGNTGTISGATWSTAGRFGNALSFDGVNDWVTVNDSNSLDLAGTMTVEAWVRPSTITGWETVLMKESGTTTYTYGLYADDNGNDGALPRRPAMWIVQGGGYIGVQGASQLPVNTWTHLAATYDGTVLRLYVNGAQAGSLTRTGSIDVSTGPLRIGGNAIWGEYFNGLIDEVRLYNRVLSAAEIQADMNAPVEGGPDTTAPTVGSVTPASGATGVATTANVTATFSEAMDTATVTATTFELRDSANVLVPAAVSYNSANNTATLDPTSALAFGATYTARVKGGAGGVKDAAGNPLAADFTWSFTTALPTLSVNDVTVTEGNTGTVNAVFTVTLSAASAQPVTVTYATANGTATAGTDYTAASGTLTIPAGSTTGTITVAVSGDTLSEADETFFVNLSSPTNATIADGQGKGSITNDDAPPPTLTINDVSVTEGNSGTVSASFTVTLSAASTQTVTVTYATANGTATAGSDYTAVAATTLTFSPGQTSKTVTVSVLGDTAGEGNETFFVNLTSPTNATLADSQGQGTIVDDDAVLIGTDGFGYSAYTTPFEALDLVQGAVGVFTIRNTGGNNTNTVNLPSGNTFNFYGTSFTSLVVSTNGLITFGGGTNSATNTDLTASPTLRSIATLWDDWEDITSSAMILGRYDDTDGDGGNDRLVVEWNVQGSPISPSPVMFQAILRLNTGAQAGGFTFNYPDTDSGDTRTDGASATVGIKDVGTQGANRLLVSFNGTSPYVGSGKAIRFAATPDTTSPTVSVTSPAGGATVSGTVTVTADASDNVGVAGVQFLLDGVALGAEDTAAPYSVSWNTATASNGTHTLTARARDAAGNTTTSTAVTVTVSNQAPTGGLVAAYGFNETAGTTAADNSGGGHAGTVSGAAWATGGKYGGALSFDGVNDWVTVNDAAALDLTTALTLEAWVRPAAVSGWRTVILKEAGTEEVYAIYGNEDVARPLGAVRIDGAYQIATGTTGLALNTWTHLASTYDGTALRLYVNGTQAGSVAASGSIEVSSGVLRIGGNAIWGEFFAGLIDEVRVYSRALTAAEIQTDMNTPVGSPERLMGEEAAAGDAAPLGQQELRPLFDEAVARWSAELGDPEAVERLRAVRVEILDLPGTTLGLASAAVIYLDANGAGHSWFLDPTPWEDSEFAPNAVNGLAAGRVDLLTVIAHELGHILGLEDDPTADPFTGSVMADVLPLGVRRIQLDGLLPEVPSMPTMPAADAVPAEGRARPIPAKDLIAEAAPGGAFPALIPAGSQAGVETVAGRLLVGPRPAAVVAIFTTDPVLGSAPTSAGPVPPRHDEVPEATAAEPASAADPFAQEEFAYSLALVGPPARVADRGGLDLLFENRGPGLSDPGDWGR